MSSGSCESGDEDQLFDLSIQAESGPTDLGVVELGLGGRLVLQVDPRESAR